MILIARGLRGSRGVTSLVKFKVYFYLNSGRTKEALGFFQSQMQYAKSSVHA